MTNVTRITLVPSTKTSIAIIVPSQQRGRENDVPTVLFSFQSHCRFVTPCVTHFPEHLGSWPTIIHCRLDIISLKFVAIVNARYEDTYELKLRRFHVLLRSRAPLFVVYDRVNFVKLKVQLVTQCKSHFFKEIFNGERCFV